MKTILLLALLSLVVSANAQQPAIKFYLDDGTTKVYNIDDIDSFAVSKNNFYVMHIYYQDTKIAYYPNEIIQSVKIEKDTNNNHFLYVTIFGYPKTYIVSDIDSIVFKVDKWQPLTIGEQVWMLKNLDVDHYRNGDSIPEARDSETWINLKTGAWCNYNNSDSIGKIYGKLYNWYAVNDSRSLAPIGWHVSSDAEWSKLTLYLGDVNVAGGKLKETGTTHWINTNTEATNESGFSAFPGGGRYLGDGTSYYIGSNGNWWTAMESTLTMAWYRILGCDNTYIIKLNSFKANGFSVRCIKD